MAREKKEKQRKLFTEVVRKDGKKVQLLTPAGKADKYAKELKNNAKADTGEVLSATDRSYRVAYLTARRDDADVYLYNKAKKGDVKAAAALKESKEKRKAAKSRRRSQTNGYYSNKSGTGYND